MIVCSCNIDVRRQKIDLEVVFLSSAHREPDICIDVQQVAGNRSFEIFKGIIRASKIEGFSKEGMNIACVGQRVVLFVLDVRGAVSVLVDLV